MNAAPQRVLLVEDDEMHAELVRRSFEESPTILLTVARRVDEAKSALDEATPDMIVADLNLPDGKGIELVHGATYPVVIMTSHGSEAAAVEAMKAGALDYVVKSEAMFVEMPHIVARALREWSHMQAHARTTRFLQAQYAVASALATSRTVEAAGPEVLEALCRRVGWAMGEFWRLDSESGLLRRDAFWSAAPGLERTATGDDEPSLSVGQGLPGATWQSGHTLSVADVRDAPPFGQHHLAPDSELHGAFGFPVGNGGEPLGVLTFYSREVEPPDEDLRQLLAAVSNQLALLVQRQQADEERARMQEELVDKERLAAVGQTAASLGHEIANPLNGIYVASQLVQRRIRKMSGVDPKIFAGLDMVMKENRRLTALLEEFRSLSRRQIITPVPTNVGTLIEHVLEIQAGPLEHAGVAASSEVGPSIPLVEVDDAKLTQVLLNLTKNAIEAMSEGGGTLTIRASLVGAELVLEVEDTGPGVPLDIDVFEPFRSTKPHGTGLGLAIAQQIVAAHGGSLDQVRDVPLGAVFRIVLPATQP